MPILRPSLAVTFTDQPEGLSNWVLKFESAVAMATHGHEQTGQEFDFHIGSRLSGWLHNS